MSAGNWFAESVFSYYLNALIFKLKGLIIIQRSYVSFMFSFQSVAQVEVTGSFHERSVEL